MNEQDQVSEETGDVSQETTDSREGDIVILLGEETYRGNYIDDLRIDEARINDALKEQPIRFAFWGQMYALQKAISEKLKNQLERYEGHLEISIRAQKAQQGEKVTESVVRSLINVDPERERLQNSIIRASAKLSKLQGIRDSFAQRKDMLMSLSANLRGEMEMTGMSLNEREFVRRRTQPEASENR